MRGHHTWENLRPGPKEKLPALQPANLGGTVYVLPAEGHGPRGLQERERVRCGIGMSETKPRTKDRGRVWGGWCGQSAGLSRNER